MTDTEKMQVIVVLILLFLGMMLLGGIAYGLLLLTKAVYRSIKKLFI